MEKSFPLHFNERLLYEICVVKVFLVNKLLSLKYFMTSPELQVAQFVD
jgi:hypothetical protein